MEDQEFDSLKKRFLIGLVIIIVFVSLCIIILNRVFNNYDGDIYKDVKNNKTLVILQVSNNCEMCDSVKIVLEDRNIEFEELTMSYKDRHEDVYRLLGVESKNIKAPALFYVKKGELVAYLNDIKSDNELNMFIDNYLGG